MSSPLFSNQQEAKKSGYFSRRHRTNEAMNAAREHYFSRRLTRIQHPRPEDWPPKGHDAIVKAAREKLAEKLKK